MIWLIAILVSVLACFAAVLLTGAPYLPTLSTQITAALELADLQAGETLLELGCGDGRVLIAAARQGWQVVGYELNPLLVLVAWLRTRRYRKQVKIIWGNFWNQPWPPAQAIFIFLLPKYMPKLHKKVIQYKHKPVKLVSFAFEIPGQKPTHRKAGVFAYDYR